MLSTINCVRTLYQGSILSLTIAIVYLVNFLNARKMTSHLLAWQLDWKDPDLYYINYGLFENVSFSLVLQKNQTAFEF